MVRVILAVIAAVGFGAVSRAMATDMQVIGNTTARFVVLELSRSVVIDLPSDIKDVLLSNPKVVTVVVKSKRQVYIIGANQGQSNVYFYDDDGRQIGALDIFVQYGSPPAALENYTKPADVVVVFRSGTGWHYSCNPMTCVSDEQPNNQPDKTWYIDQNVKPNSK